MVIIDILGGGTTSNYELEFYSDNYKAKARFIKDKLEIKVESHNIKNKNKYSKIPLIRGILIYLNKNVSETGKTKHISIELIDIIVVGGYIVDKIIFKTPIMDLVYLLYIFVLFIVTSCDKNMRELHGAEHMMGNYYDKYKKIDINNIMGKIKKCSIVHERCSSNYYGIQLTILFLLKVFINDFMIRYILMAALLYEIVHYNDNKLVKILTYPLYSIGMLAQRLFFVRQPKDKDIEMAIRVVQELEKYESKF